ncbi:hypothetical protein K435DRAFT_867038 [Dendrothele bispora CBS 962.96]|uniref:Uncharacterized protein n=1 Tax=Dendrothele bispora (strain CBS 962.96) TaxID=1314807 RepID=A0A4S8LFH0_DENBC|nr:hypothetical protein K435DRAFT_867038 [Dendrothele bispora CBS 962.96]
MSVNKYANLPDIDTAQDVYETEDVFPSSQVHGDSSDEEGASSNRPSTIRVRNGEGIANKEELDSSNLIGADEAKKSRSHYAYPPSPTSSVSSVDESGKHSRPVPLSHRLRTLQAELSALELELADPSNPLLQQEKDRENVDFGWLIRGTVDVRGRLEKIKKDKEGRGKLVGVVLGENTAKTTKKEGEEKEEEEETQPNGENEAEPKVGGFQDLVEMDRRVGELEKLVGSSTSILDETSPLPPPLLTLITRVNSQLAVLTQPRHLDGISRRLKMLLSDLDRASAQQAQRRQGNAPGAGGHEDPQLVALVHRLGPMLPQIPHILTRLRTLSTLHASAGEFQGTLERVEREEMKTKEELKELESAVGTLEKSLEENRDVMKGNVEGLETRLNDLFRRFESLK